MELLSHMVYIGHFWSAKPDPKSFKIHDPSLSLVLKSHEEFRNKDTVYNFWIVCLNTSDFICTNRLPNSSFSGEYLLLVTNTNNFEEFDI